MIDEKHLLADIEGLKKSPWFNASYISDERRLGMKEALDMISSILRNSPTVDAIPVDWLREQEESVRNSDAFRDECAGVRLAWMAEAERRRNER